MLPSFPPDLSAKAERALLKLGVRTRTGAMVTGSGCARRDGAERETRRAHRGQDRAVGRGRAGFGLGKIVAERTGAPIDRAGRLIVEPDLTVPGHPEIFVIGDLANFSHQTGQPLPGVAPVAMSEGRYVARAIQARLRGEAVPPFHYFDKGNLATIGRNKAVAAFGSVHVSGPIAWFVWLFVHLMYLVEFDNRLLVLIEWIYNYVTRNRGARLITGGQ